MSKTIEDRIQAYKAEPLSNGCENSLRKHFGDLRAPLSPEEVEAACAKRKSEMADFGVSHSLYMMGYRDAITRYAVQPATEKGAKLHGTFGMEHQDCLEVDGVFYGAKSIRQLRDTVRSYQPLDDAVRRADLAESRLADAEKRVAELEESLNTKYWEAIREDNLKLTDALKHALAKPTTIEPLGIDERRLMGETIANLARALSKEPRHAAS